MYGPALSDGRGGSQQGSSGGYSASVRPPRLMAGSTFEDLPHGGLDHANVSRFAALSTLWMALWKPGLTCCNMARCAGGGRPVSPRHSVNRTWK